MMNQLPPVRRVLTAIGPDGKSYIAEAAPPVGERTDPRRPGYVLRNIWNTNSSPANIHSPDRIGELSGVLPPPNGTVIRVIDYPPQPEDPEEQKKQAQAIFESLFPDAAHQPTHTRHAGMHITDTIDYAIVLAGEITAIMEADEIVLRPGDVLIQRGTNHAWANRTKSMTRMAFILIDGSGTRQASA